ncbi:cell division protein FtsW [Salinibacterium sp. CAN_S4]|uniref:putative lipid II flippase FtsW n=1 Tax=Salinibacterium sp. CAN_S4 TaxID=2787727 RepID=UPI0018EFF5F0
MTTTRPQRTHPQGRPNPQSGPGPSSARIPLRRIFAAENSNYFLLLGVTLFLVIFGLVMVLSSSTIESYIAEQGFFGRFARQGLFAVIGIPLMLVASRMPSGFWRKWAWPALLLGGGLQLLVFVPGIGIVSGGNRNWIGIGGFTAQPSEFVKIALIVWVAWILSTKQSVLDDWRHVLLPIAPISAAAIGFVLIGGDLGTAAVMILILFGLLYFGGVKLRFLAVGAGAIAVLAYLFSKANSSRTSRIEIWLNGCTAEDYSGYCWQPEHANWALAAGGWFGKGLGNSVAKWNWLPAASSDYIFAIIGEELGLIGAIVVLVLFVVLAIAFVRIIRASTDSFGRIVTSGVMVWVIGQAFVNIAVVLGVLPVLGVPLPLISAGGTALIANLLGIGIVLSFARTTSTTPEPTVEQSPAERSRLLAAQRLRSRA